MEQSDNSNWNCVNFSAADEGAPEAAPLLLDDAASRISDTVEDKVKDLKMASVASKELSPEQKEVASSSSSSMFSMIYSMVKKVAMVGGIYLVGYMGWSVAWLIGS